MHEVSGEEERFTKRQRYCVCLELCFWAYHLLVIGLTLAVMGKVIVAYHMAVDLKDSKHYQHAEETVALWERGTCLLIKATSSTSK